MRITSLTARLAINVTFTDGSSGIIHGQVENNTAWSISQAESFENARQVSWFFAPTLGWPYWNAINAAMEKLPFVASFDFNDSPSTYPARQKSINDMAGRIDVIFTLDNGTTHAVAVIINNIHSDLYIEAGDEVLSVSNNSEVVGKFRSMAEAAIQEVFIS